MKKLIFLSVFLLVLSASMFAASARVFNQQLVLDNEPTNPDDILNYVTNTGISTSPNYILRVTANGETKGTDLGQAGQNMRVYQNTLSGQVRAIANFNQSLWTVNWVVGSNLVIDIWWVGTPAGQGDGFAPYPEYKHAQKTWVVVAGSVVSQIDANAMIVPPPYVPASDSWTYNLQVNGPAGYGFTGPQNGTMPQLLTTGPLSVEGNTLLGAYTAAAAPAGFHWVMNPITVVPGDFTGAKVDHVYNAAITFALEADPVDNYTLNVTGPDGYSIFKDTVNTGQVTDYVFMTTVDASALVGTYTLAPAPAGFHWVPAQHVVVAGDFTLAKANYGYAIDFQLVADPDTYEYNLYVNGPDGYAVTGPVAGTTDYMATDDVMADLLGDYTIAAAPAGWHWVVNPITVIADNFVLATKTNFVYNATITFVLEEDVAPLVVVPVDIATVPAGYPTENPNVAAYTATWTGIHDLFIARGVDDTAALAYIGGMWIAPTGSPDWTWLNVNFDGKGTIPIVIYGPPPAYTFTINAFDLLWYTGNGYIFGVNMPAFLDPNDLNAPIYRNGNPTGVTTPYIFGAPGNLPFLAGAYSVVLPPYVNWLPSDVTFINITTSYDADFLGELPLTPVELSSFTATLTAETYVQLTWVSQTETQMMGYLVYRNTSNDQSTSTLIDHPMIPATNTSSTQAYTVVDNDVNIGTTYYYWLEAVDFNSSSYHGPVSVTVEGNVPPVLPEVTSMKNAYPNPFKANSNTTIEVAVKAGENGTVTIYNVLGQVVKTVSVTEGTHNINWNGKDSKGNACGSGIYFYKLSTPSINVTKKMVIVK